MGRPGGAPSRPACRPGLGGRAPVRALRRLRTGRFLESGAGALPPGGRGSPVRPGGPPDPDPGGRLEPGPHPRRPLAVLHQPGRPGRRDPQAGPGPGAPGGRPGAGCSRPVGWRDSGSSHPGPRHRGAASPRVRGAGIRPAVRTDPGRHPLPGRRQPLDPARRRFERGPGGQQLPGGSGRLRPPGPVVLAGPGRAGRRGRPPGRGPGPVLDRLGLAAVGRPLLGPGTALPAAFRPGARGPGAAWRGAGPGLGGPGPDPRLGQPRGRLGTGPAPGRRDLPAGPGRAAGRSPAAPGPGGPGGSSWPPPCRPSRASRRPPEGMPGMPGAASCAWAWRRPWGRPRSWASGAPWAAIPRKPSPSAGPAAAWCPPAWT